MRTLESEGMHTPDVGYGTIMLEDPYGIHGGRAVEDKKAGGILRDVVDMGFTHIDTANAYGNGHSEAVVGKALGGALVNEDIVVATKVGLRTDFLDARPHPTNWGFPFPVNGRPDYINEAVDQSLSRLNGIVPVVYLHYTDPEVPIEESVGALAELKAAGKIRGIGLSNIVDVAQLERAHAEHPVDFVQNEFSLQKRALGGKVLEATQDLGITFVAWSPLGAGMLVSDITKLPETDPRRLLQFENGQIPQTVVEDLETFHQMAERIDVTPAQLALAWIRHQGDNTIAIPGSRNTSRIRENRDSLGISLNEAQLQELDALSFDGFRPMLG